MNKSEELLGLDIGDQRTGVARMNMMVKIPEPLPILEGAVTPQTVIELAEKQGAQRIVMGLPQGLSSGAETGQSAKVRVFASELTQSTKLPVELIDESLSTALAAKWRARYPEAAEDSLAACVILERYLEHKEADR